LLNPEFVIPNTTVASNGSGGTSLGNPSAGSGQLPIPGISAPTERDNAIAGLVTGLTNIGMFLFASYMVR